MSEFGDFLNRVKTYSFDKWTLRSSKILPYHLASWGFVCVEEDTFQCQMCEQRISASHLPFPSEIEEGNIINMDLLEESFFGIMRNTHREECEYNQESKNNPAFFTLDHSFLASNMSNLYALIFRSYEILDDSLTSNHSFYPKLDTSFLKIIIRKALSAFAWRYEEDSRTEKKSLTCDYCARTISLNNYPQSPSRYMNINAGSADLGFNPFEEHKYFCRWGSADVQFYEQNSVQIKQSDNTTSQKSASGWNICLNYLLDEFAYRTKKQKKTFGTVNEIHKMQEAIKQISNEFKGFESGIKDRYAQIAKDCESLNIDTTSTQAFKRKLSENRQSIDELLKDFEFNQLLADPIKKQKKN